MAIEVQEAGRQPPQAAVAERGIGLALGHLFELLRVLRHRLRRTVSQAQRGQRVCRAMRPIRNSIDR